MAELQHAQIHAKLLEEIVPFIDVSDLQSHPAQQLKSHALSRAVAVTAARLATDVEISTAARALVDGANDNGLDLIFYEPQNRVLVLIQSKWSSAHASSIESGEALKFLQGVQDLVSLKKERFNEKIQSRWPEIEDALKRLASVRLIIAYPGSGGIDQYTLEKVDQFIKSQNDTSELFFFDCFTQRDYFQYFVQEAAPPRINLTLKLSHFGLVEEPLRAVYGQVSALDVAQWYRAHGSNYLTETLGVSLE